MKNEDDRCDCMFSHQIIDFTPGFSSKQLVFRRTFHSSILINSSTWKLILTQFLNTTFCIILHITYLLFPLCYNVMASEFTIATAKILDSRDNLLRSPQ